MEDGAADELDVVMALAEGAPRGLPHDGESLRQQIVQIGAVAQTLAKLIGFGAQGGIVQRLDAGFKGVDLGDEAAAELGGGALRRVADYFFQKRDHRDRILTPYCRAYILTSIARIPPPRRGKAIDLAGFRRRQRREAKAQRATWPLCVNG